MIGTLYSQLIRLVGWNFILPSSKLEGELEKPNIH